MKKPLNYRLQMYRALVEKMCTNCWFWCIFCGFTLFFVCIRGFLTIFATQNLVKRYELQFVERKKRHYFWCSE